MKPANWKDIAELIGITAIVASLIFVGLQMRQAQDIAISDGNLANAANRIERNNSIGANPDIWLRGNSGEELDKNDAVIFHSMFQNTYDVAFFEFVRTRRLGSNVIAANVAADFSAFLFKNPGARNLWSEEEQDNTKYRKLLVPSHQDKFSEFTAMVNSNLAELDQLQK